MTDGEEAVPVASGARATSPPASDAAVDVARVAAEVDWDSALPAGARDAGWRAGQVLKRILDVIAAGILLIILIPFFALIAVATVLDSGWPVLYPWVVVGYRGRRFTGYKFRTMVRHADRMKHHLRNLNSMTAPVFKIRDDPRVTRLGRVFRRYSVDELPQLWSVLVGHMSLVGPRPMFPEEFARATPLQRRKLAVRPGITCLWQIAGRADITDFEEWIRLDMDYISRWRLRLDIVILWRTVWAVLGRRGAY